MAKKKEKRWIQKAIKRPGRVKEYMRKRFGKKAFNKDGTIKVSYIKKALKTARSKSIKSALNLALRLKKM